LKSVAAGLRAWHFFAILVLLYNAERSLPPKCSADIQRFITIFVNAGTAANYVSYIMWACRLKNLCTEWRDSQISMVLKGLDRKSLRTQGSKLVVRLLLDDEKIRQLIHFLDAFCPLLADAALVWYEFLLRVQSEGLHIVVGTAEWMVDQPANIEASLWTSSEIISLRLTSRKNRPRGSLLRRRCRCTKMRGSQFCVFHRLAGRL